MKLEVLVANEPALKTLVETKFENAQFAWDLSIALDEVEKAIKKFHEGRDKYIKDNGVADEKNPERFNIKDPESFGAEMKKRLDVEVQINFPTLSLQEAIKSGIQLNVRDITAFRKLGILTK